MFQFYLSSIKSALPSIDIPGLREFQFYLSSIKRFLEASAQVPQLCFNSTLVQLKGQNACLSSTIP